MSSECIVEIPEGTNRSRTDIPNPRSQDVSNTDSLSHLEKSPIKINDQSPQIRDLQAGKESSDRSSYKRAPSAKWYFKEDPEKYSRNEYVFSCTSEHQPPVKTPAANRFTRCIRRPDDTQKIKSGVFNIVLGISIANLNLDYIESISFNFGPDIPYYSDPLEVITADELRRLSATSGSRESRWGLHRQFDETKSFMKSFAVDMEIRKSLSAPPKLDLGFVELFYVELHEFRVDTFQNGKKRVTFAHKSQ
ncbi:hypothetical protein EDD21DRAFT_108099 [Dissophora ornata]|nr:hypothetical protein EDD21DRAFT_108099 [Dissophora ornata]